MAHSLSAKKRIRQSLKRRARNRARKEVLKNDLKAVTAAFTAGDAVKAEAALLVAVARLDKTAVKHTIHKNTAARKRSRLTLKLNKLKAGALTAPAAPGSKPPKAAKAKKAAPKTDAGRGK